MAQNVAKDTLRYYWRQTRPYTVVVSLLWLGLIGASVLEVIIPLYYKKFFDVLASPTGPTTETVNRLWRLVLLVAALHGLGWLLFRLLSFVTNWVIARVMTNVYQQTFDHLQRHSFGFFSNHFVGSLVKRVVKFVSSFERLYGKVYWDLLPLAVRLFGIIIVLYTMNAVIAGILLGWTLLFIVLNYRFALWKLRYDKARSEKDSETTAVLADAITNATNIRLFHGFRFELGRIRKVTEELRQLRLLTWNLGDTLEAIQGVLMIGVEIGLMIAALHYWKLGLLTVGTFVLLQTYMLYLFDRLWNFGRLVREVYEAFSDAEEMTAILNTPHEIVDTATAQQLGITGGSIEFRDVSFSYHQTRTVLHHINLAISAGEKIALIGPSGSGKSTIVKLLFRLYDIDRGKILLDGQKIQHVTQESLHAALSLVPQDPILFHRTLMENIRYGKRDATEVEVIEAAKLAHCHEFIETFPYQYETYVGERGVKLSGGERQRVAIARAILKNAPILVLDEATSSLDSESEALIQDALKKLLKDKTAIVIAHRLSTIQQMDRIIVLDNGRIIEEGSHQKLLQNPQSLYRRLWKLQAGGFLVDEQAEEDPEAEIKNPEAGEEKSDDEEEEESLQTKKVRP